MLAFDCRKEASALASAAFALARLASSEAGSISNKTSPACTSAPSVNRRFNRMPVARARTCASRTAVIRPGNSVVCAMRSAATRTTETSAGGRAGGLAAVFPHPLSHTPSAAAVRQRTSALEIFGFISCNSVARNVPGPPSPATRARPLTAKMVPASREGVQPSNLPNGR